MSWLKKKINNVKSEVKKKRLDRQQVEQVWNHHPTTDAVAPHVSPPQRVCSQPVPQHYPAPIPRVSSAPVPGRTPTQHPLGQNAKPVSPNWQPPIQNVSPKNKNVAVVGNRQIATPRPPQSWNIWECERAVENKWMTEEDLEKAKATVEKGEDAVIELFKLPDVKPVKARKYTCQFVPGKPVAWKTEEIEVQLEETTLSSGSLRHAFRMIDHSRPLGKRCCAAKQAKEDIDGENIYFTDVAMQEECRYYGQMFNARNPPKRVQFVESWVIEVLENQDTLPRIRRLYGAEPFLSGKYMKHSNNTGFADDRNTPHAFSHFTYEFTNGQLMVVDIQGVQDSYTDPQIHSLKETNYGVGNLGRNGFVKFFETHKCNAVCKQVGLTLCRNKKGMEEGTHIPKLSSGNHAANGERPKSRVSTPQAF